MNFEEILNQWETQTQHPYGKKRIRKEAKGPMAIACTIENTQTLNPMDYWVRRYGVYDKDADNSENISFLDNLAEKRRLRAMRPQAEIDLHGMTLEEAYGALVTFLKMPCAESTRKFSLYTVRGTILKTVRYCRGLYKNFWKQMPMQAKPDIPKDATGAPDQRG